MALPQTNQGFLGNIETVNTDVTSESVPSAFLGKEALQPTYEVASLQRNIPTVPTIDVTGSGDLYSGSNDLSYIVDLTTDPETIKKRREEEKKLRARLDPDVDPLFATDPGVNITAAGISANVPDFKIEGTKPTIERGRLDTSTDITDRIVRFGEAVELGANTVVDPFGSFYKDRALDYAKQQGLGTAADIFKTGVLDPLQEKYVDPYLDPLKEKAKTAIEPYKDRATSYIKDIFGSSTAAQSYRNLANPFALSDPFSSSYQAATIANPATSSYQPSLVTPSSTSSFANTASKVAQGAGIALSAYNAYDSFKQGDKVGGVTSTIATIALLSGNPGIAAAMAGLNFVSGITGWGRGKPKPGMGGSEIRYNRDTGQLDHSMTWAYNGFNPSQAKQHTDQARNFINGYMKEFNVKFDPEKASRLGQYHTRIDVSPYRNGSQSAGELIERWMSSGAFTGNPSYYDADAGERRFFTSQEEYEAAVNRFSNRVFS